MTQTKLQSEIRSLIEQCRGHEDIILRELKLPVDRWGNVKCQCPIHNGDNPNGFSWSAQKNCWKCWTHQCHEDYGSSIFGLVRAMKDFSAQEAKEYIEELLNIKSDSLSIIDLDRKDYIRSHTPIIADEEQIFNKDILLKAEKDYTYLLDRGFNNTILEKFGAFYVNNAQKPLYRRITFPIYNKHDNIVGFTGRITDEVSKPKWFHYPTRMRTRNYLFGLNQNRSEVERTHTAILNEGPLDVLRESQAELNLGVGTFGVELSKRQIDQLLNCKVHNLILCYDPDDAGQKGIEKIIQHAQLYFRLYNFSHLLHNGPSKSSIEEIKNILIPEVKKVCSNL